jgi:hypothetical protein
MQSVALARAQRGDREKMAWKNFMVAVYLVLLILQREELEQHASQ